MCAFLMKPKLLLLAALPMVLPALVAQAQFPVSEFAVDLTGAADLHLHTAPDVFDRSINDLEVARISRRYGLSAIVLKNHSHSTAGRAELVNQVVPGIDVYGGIVLNNTVGGINPAAVESMAALSPKYGKFVWLPTFDADFHKKQNGNQESGIEVVSNGTIIPELHQVLELMAKHDLTLCTGHIAPESVLAVVKAAGEIGVRKILVTHGVTDVPGLSDLQIEQLIALKAKIELTFLSTLAGPEAHVEFLRNSGKVSFQETAQLIKKYGAEHFVLTSDLGQSGNPIPPDGLKQFALGLLKQGISQQEIRVMIVDNPMGLINK